MRSPDPALITAALALLETAANRALSLDPATARDLGALGGRVYLFECTQPALSVYLEPLRSGRIRLKSVHEGAADCSLRGSAADFLELARAEDPASTLINGKLALHGDSAPLLALQRVIATLDLDWEAPLTRVLGDVPGHQLAQLLRGAFRWSQNARSSLERQLGEFIHEEARLAPPPLELEDFFNDVRQLGMRIERLEARARRLNARLARLQGL
jgi:ubiquinone biosynthesis accessory factor UbiJ